MTTRAMEPDMEILGALRSLVRDELDRERAECGELETEVVERVYGGLPIDPERARLILEGEEDPTLTELAQLLASLGVGWAELGRRLRAVERRGRSSGPPPDYEGVRWDVREERLRQSLEEHLDRRLGPILDRIRRLEEEAGDDEADQGH